MVDVIVAMGVGVLIGAFGVIAWALSAVNKDRGEKDDRDQAGKADSPYRVMRQAAEDKEVLGFEETDADGTKIQFDAQVSVKRTGGGVNGVIEFELTMIVQSDIDYVDPA